MRKKDKRGQFERTLLIYEREALHQVFSNDRKYAEADLRIANQLLDEMDRKELWVECDCIEPEEGQEKPFNCEVKGKKRATLMHVHTSGHHDEKCPLYRLIREREGNNPTTEAKISPLIPVGGDDWLPEKKKAAKVNPAEVIPRTSRSRRKQLKPVPALGRKLLTLIQAAGLNHLELYPACSTKGLTAAIAAINEVLSTNTMRNGTYLSELFTCSPWLNKNDIDQMLKKLESGSDLNTSNKELCIYIIGLAKIVTKEEIVFKINGKLFTHRPEARVSINGENSHNAGCREPYWAILEYRRGQNGMVYCHAGYAHAAESLDNTVPVDSIKEKETLNVIIKACDFVCRQKNPPVAISLIKPLFSMKSVKDGVEDFIHPDFILNVVPAGDGKIASFIIETMGYDLAEYVERKGRTHEVMRREGCLLTDPPGWPEASEKSFNSYLLSHIFKAIK